MISSMALETIGEALNRASLCLKKAGVQSSRTEADIILAYLLGIDRLRLLSDRDMILNRTIQRRFENAIERRCRHEPLAYITGEKYFYGRPFQVTRDVLIPRPETEQIIECALDWRKQLSTVHNNKIRAIDLGTGSGIIAITLMLELEGLEMWAVDISADAISLARKNAGMYGVDNKFKWLQGSYLSALNAITPKPVFNLVTANPPYLNDEDIKTLPREIKDYEPIGALSGGSDGLNGYREILEHLEAYITRPFLLLLEIGADQKDQVENLCRSTGLFESMIWHYDLAGWPRILEGRIG
ncbi:MAG: peptide chain release factor N(5)-glutamine methyltransferase [Bacillota bacterium]|nr:peptide chain release factor N(5)-glutamine methyltransferase [Bacillota bacterium]